MNKSTKIHKSKLQLKKTHKMKGSGFLSSLFKKKTSVVSPLHISSNQDKENNTTVANISIIGNEIDNFKNILQTEKNANIKTDISTIIRYLESHIQSLNTARAKLLYNKNNKELYNNKGLNLKNNKGISLEKLKHNSKILTNKQHANKKTYTILLLVNNSIIKIIKTQKNMKEKIKEFLKLKQQYEPSVIIPSMPSMPIHSKRKTRIPIITNISNSNSNSNSNFSNSSLLNSPTNKLIKTLITNIDERTQKINETLVFLKNKIILKNIKPKLYEYDTIPDIIKYLTKHIENINVFKTEIKYKSQQSKNTAYKLLLVNRFIYNIIIHVTNTSHKINALYTLFKYIENNNNYTITEFINVLKAMEKTAIKNDPQTLFEEQTSSNNEYRNNKKTIEKLNIEQQRQLELNNKKKNLLTLITTNNISEITNNHIKKEMINKEFMPSFFNALINNKSIKILDLSNIINENNYTKDNIELLCNYINNETCILENLNLTNCQITANDFIDITSCIISNSKIKIKTLVLDNNNIGYIEDTSSKQQLDLKISMNLSFLLLPNQSKLEKLSLNNCGFGNNMYIKTIINTISLNDSLISFDFYNNQIKDEEILELSKLFLDNEQSTMTINLYGELLNVYERIKLNNIKLIVSEELAKKINLVIKPILEKKAILKAKILEEAIKQAENKKQQKNSNNLYKKQSQKQGNTLNPFF